MISLRAYAKHRDVSVVAVSRAVKSGRLRASVTRDHRGQPKIADVALADQEWTENTDHGRAPAFVKERGLAVQTSAPSDNQPLEPPPAPTEEAPAAGDTARELSLSEASAEEKRWRAKLAELTYQQRAGELVPAKDVADRLTNIFTVCRTKLLAIPSKAKAAIPALTHADVAVLDDLVRQALEELALEQIAAAPSSGAAA
jgi:hypothetical protein